MRRLFGIISLLFVGGTVSLLMLPSLLQAAPGVPKILNHQGRLLNASGALIGGAGTPFCFRFSFYDDATPGGTDNRLWPILDPSPMTATVVQGVFNVNIGGGTDALTFDFQSTDEVYLNVEVATMVGATCNSGDGLENYETMNPRQRISATGYAINSDAVDGFSTTQAGAASSVLVSTAGGDLEFAAGNGLDTAAAGALLIGGISNATSVSICNSATCDQILLGTNTDADTITIGDTNDVVSLSSSDWSIASTGLATLTDLTANSAFDIDIDDNTASSLTISEGANNYLVITTTDGAEVITLGFADVNVAL
ncbi:hypothetical protein HY628_02370, partial [Candidatus Uhrbacteria bacterium]|nr:hypothetical protein [Candidatus Uhrbacteria bacterium]